MLIHSVHHSAGTNKSRDTPNRTSQGLNWTLPVAGLWLSITNLMCQLEQRRLQLLKLAPKPLADDMLCSALQSQVYVVQLPLQQRRACSLMSSYALSTL